MVRNLKQKKASAAPKKKRASIKKTSLEKTKPASKIKKKSVKPKSSKEAKSVSKPTKKAVAQKRTALKKTLPVKTAKKTVAKKALLVPLKKSRRSLQAPVVKKGAVEKKSSARRLSKSELFISTEPHRGTGDLLRDKRTQAQSPFSAAAFGQPRIPGELPLGYGDHFIYLMICSPYQLYVYWEIQSAQEAAALRRLGGDWKHVRSVLRVYQLSENQVQFFYDLELVPDAVNWFLSVNPNESYRVEIGLRHFDGRFEMLAKSNDVTTPRVTPSELLDESWTGLDADKMYALSGGFSPDSSAEELRRMMEARLRDGMTSGSGAGMISSEAFGNHQETRDFWFTLDCELIVYGATKPGARVSMNNQNVQLRPDGTFTLRYALPDGKIRLEAKATSEDQLETRTITPLVQRVTERPEPVIRPARGQG